MKKLISPVVLFISLVSLAQDTTIIQTFTFDSISNRRATYVFPDGSDSYERILMHYTLKCDPQTPWDSYDCGEWDYVTYTNIYEHTGTLDSNKYEHPLFTINELSPDSVQLSYIPIYDYYQKYQYSIVYDSTTSENIHQISSGTTPFTSNGTSNIRFQILFLASELNTAGVTTGNIDGLTLNITSANNQANNLNIKMQHVTNNSVAGITETGFQEVYHHSINLPSGINRLNFTNPFNWDGASNLLIEISYDNPNGAAQTFTSETVGHNCTALSEGNNEGYLEFKGNEIVSLIDQNIFNNINDEITISFWANGDVVNLPGNTSVLSGANTNNERTLNIHFPWSNENIYMDFGQDGSGYDRINKAATAAEYKGNWNHWAFTKNATTGVMKIYLNGTLWHSGTAKYKSMQNLQNFILGSDNTRQGNINNYYYYYHGKVDELRIWNKEIQATEISNWMMRDVDNTHPDYASLLAYFKFNETGFQAMNEMGGVAANLLGMPTRGQFKTQELNRNVNLTNVRPNIQLIQGTYTSHLDSTLVTDSIMQTPTSIVVHQVQGNTIIPTDTIYGWHTTVSTIYDPSGNVANTIPHAADSLINNQTLIYYGEPFEKIAPHEIGRYITPYGIGFSLGNEGFTWVYDVSDYVHLLKDSVDISAGNLQELIDLKFLFIKGTPPRDVVKMEELWGEANFGYFWPAHWAINNGHSYGNLDNDIDLSALQVQLDSTASQYKIKTRITGHGHNATGSLPHCCEWADKQHSISVNGQNAFNWSIWQGKHECALNPIGNQGGTWPYARAGWCPGDDVKDHEFELTPLVNPGDLVTLDYDIEDIPSNNPDQAGGSYSMTMQLVSYGAPNFNLDARIAEILSPNNEDDYRMITNPCTPPRIVIQNTGATTLTSLTISYYVVGGISQTYQWAGNLEFLEKEEVELPIPGTNFYWDFGNSTSKEFEVKCTSPNGGQDEYPNNNIMRRAYNLPNAFPNHLMFWHKSNNEAYQNSYELRDLEGNVLLSRDNLTNNTQYKDTLLLNPGCYTLEFTDTGDDGVSFWANSNDGSGYLRIREIGVGTIMQFDMDFGHKIIFPFSVGGALSTQELVSEELYFQVYPNPAKKSVTVELDRVEEGTLQLINLQGKLIWSENHTTADGYVMQTIDLSGVQSGLYFIKATSKNGDTISVKKLVVD